MSKEKLFEKNCTRVREIYGIDKNDHSYNIHHVIFKRDVKKDKGMWKGFNINQLSNLIPLKREEHDRLHRIVDNLENYASMPKKRKRKRRR